MPRTSHIATALLLLYTVIYALASTFHGWELRHVLASAALAPVLVALTSIDIATLRLPDPLTLLVFALGVAVTALDGAESVLWNLIAAAAGFLSLVAVAHLYQRFRGQAGLGFGDAKLYSAAGMWVGFEGLASVLLLACASALVAVGVAFLNGRRITTTTPFPFGPFLCFGFWATWSFAPLL
jgi:leader peptidase (prepilin peptidase)/N-methyltransferase